MSCGTVAVSQAGAFTHPACHYPPSPHHLPTTLPLTATTSIPATKCQPNPPKPFLTLTPNPTSRTHSNNINNNHNPLFLFLTHHTPSSSINGDPPKRRRIDKEAPAHTMDPPGDRAPHPRLPGEVVCP